MTEKKRVRRKSKIDSLTGLITLNYFLELGTAMLEKGYQVTILVVDLNYFKRINESFGYIAGNEVLFQVAKHLRHLLKGYVNIIARLGGDEFIVAVKDYPQENQDKLSNLISLSLNNTLFNIDIGFEPQKLSFSIGEANSINYPNSTIEALLNHADKNMYLNKFSNYVTLPTDHLDTYEIPDIFVNFLKILAEKDAYTYVHSLFTAKNAAILAKKLGLSKQKINDIYIAGLLHDIGKILLPNDILKKPMKLSHEEYEYVKLHVNYGLNILRDIAISQITVNAIKCHHYRWDGSGYPEPVKGNDTPLEGRILQIADAFTAMTVKRLYRNSLTFQEAEQELLENSGTQFDPLLVKIFLEVLHETNCDCMQVMGD